jgi:diguanylate cyclase (GGDEF)-like protein
VDIDHFKSVNDTYGHQTGDEVLSLVASCLQQAARKQDVVCRVGGEEFMVICPDSDVAAAYTYAERMRQQVSAQTLTVSGHALRLTVSIGLTDNAQMGTIDAMLHLSDTRLYAAKAAGRNCTVSA